MQRLLIDFYLHARDSSCTRDFMRRNPFGQQNHQPHSQGLSSSRQKRLKLAGRRETLGKRMRPPLHSLRSWRYCSHEVPSRANNTASYAGYPCTVDYIVAWEGGREQSMGWQIILLEARTIFPFSSSTYYNSTHFFNLF